ncbi:EGF-like domain-containing protein [Cryptosporidium muris RN66]|uniref:EGF-like domain-containing protein n=1 Tax=Cryptosporidium muris (strain RN66) TaxID=441375 RepID=B6AJB0_CRYMR|nr:EGF-like domain-containing protein [Cryptosporidium muris RN66]EEA08248.1 EGF-like domain-containing protein [Cryptosporidium muris RN66]|eukprot:XP_002142597.1 EGF-like domain-containing protein [Cryptosporidium muris RN66]
MLCTFSRCSDVNILVILICTVYIANSVFLTVVATNVQAVDTNSTQVPNSSTTGELSQIPFESICSGDQQVNCGQNGKCFEVGVLEDQRQYICICIDGYTGPKCDTKWDACLSAGPTNLCLNGGICTSTMEYPYYSCKCLSGYTGLNCNIANNICITNNPCQNGGKCTFISPSEPVLCTCSRGYTGQYCQDQVYYGIGGAGVYLYPSQIIFTWIILILLLASIAYCTLSVIMDFIAIKRAERKKRLKEEKNKGDDTVPSEEVEDFNED